MHSNQNIDTFRQYKEVSVQPNTFASFGPGQRRPSPQQSRPANHSFDTNLKVKHLDRCNCENEESILKNRDKVYNCEICNRLRQVCPYTTKNSCLQCFKSEIQGSQTNNPNIRIQESHVNPKGFRQSINTNAPSNSNYLNYRIPLDVSNNQKFNRSASTRVPLQKSILSSPAPMVQQIIFYPVIHNRFVRIPLKNKLQLRDLRRSYNQQNNLQESSIKVKQFHSDKKHKKRKIFNTQLHDSNRKSIGPDATELQRHQYANNYVEINGFINRISPEKNIY